METGAAQQRGAIYLYLSIVPPESGPATTILQEFQERPAHSGIPTSGVESPESGPCTAPPRATSRRSPSRGRARSAKKLRRRQGRASWPRLLFDAAAGVGPAHRVAVEVPPARGALRDRHLTDFLARNLSTWRPTSAVSEKGPAANQPTGCGQCSSRSLQQSIRTSESGSLRVVLFRYRPATGWEIESNR